MPDEVTAPTWIERSVAIIEAAEAGLPIPSFLADDTFPAWVEKVLTHIMKTSMPGIAWKEPKHWTPGELGAFLGGKTVYWGFEERYNPSELLEYSGYLKKEGDRRGTAVVIKYLRTLWRVGLPQCRDAVHQCFGLVLDDASRHEKIRFFRSYSKAIAEPQDPDGGPARATTATPIYCFLLIYWRHVEKLNSMSELHALLCKVFGNTKIGDQKRVEKICERIGLSFAKRPLAKLMPNATDNLA